MSGTDILGISTSALLAYQQALQTTGNNVANANTPGYSRERVDLSANPSQPVGNYYIGSGVNVSGIQRIVSQFANKQVSDATSANARYQAYSQYAQQVDNLLGQSSTGLQSSLQSFFNSVQTVSNNPSSIAARQQLIAQGGSLVGRFNTLYQQINGIGDQLNSKISNDVSTINSLASQIAKLNNQIVTDGNSQVSGKPNSLLDQRTHLINELSKQVSVNTTTQSNGAMNVMIGTGQALVVGTTVTKLGTAPLTTGDPSQLGLVFKTQAGNEPVSNVVTGGNLGGLLETRKKILSPALNGLGRLAIGISTAFNEQQKKGIDLTGNFGSNFFTTPSASIFSSPNNPTGDSTPSVSISQISKLTTNNYQLSYNGSNWSLTNTGTNQSVPLQAVSGSPNTYTADGLTIQVPTTNITAGDSFTIKPTRYAARDISMAMTDPRQVAAAVPVTSAANQTNTGTGAIGKPQIVNQANVNLRDKVTITMTSATTFNVVDQTSGTTLATNQTYNPSGTTINYNGWQATLSGSAANGDTFTVSPTGSGNNGNALKLAALQQKNILEYGTTASGNGTTSGGPVATLGQANSQLVADIGTKTQSAQNNASNQKQLLNQANSMQQSISGVNLDQQASNLLKYQQDYQASAKVIATAKTLFQTLLNAVG